MTEKITVTLTKAQARCLLQVADEGFAALDSSNLNLRQSQIHAAYIAKGILEFAVYVPKRRR